MHYVSYITYIKIAFVNYTIHLDSNWSSCLNFKILIRLLTSLMQNLANLDFFFAVVYIENEKRNR